MFETLVWLLVLGLKTGQAMFEKTEMPGTLVELMTFGTLVVLPLDSVVGPYRSLPSAMTAAPAFRTTDGRCQTGTKL
jgi:hypothetical protein